MMPYVTKSPSKLALEEIDRTRVHAGGQDVQADRVERLVNVVEVPQAGGADGGVRGVVPEPGG
jgi:hypothetical protein